MSTQAAEQHEKATEHHQAGNREKAVHHAHTVRGHHEQATRHASEAAKYQENI